MKKGKEEENSYFPCGFVSSSGEIEIWSEDDYLHQWLVLPKSSRTESEAV
jgi:hypothetical protein